MKYVARSQVRKGAYDFLEADAQKVMEKNDCAVKAAAVVCGVPYLEAREVLREAGRKYGGRTHTCQIHAAVNKLGRKVVRDNDFVYDRVEKLCNSGYVVKHLTTRQLTMFPELAKGGTWLAYTNGHVLAIKDGMVHCWGATKALRITCAYKLCD